MFERLHKIFYANREQHAKSYQDRFFAPFSVRLPFSIRQFGHSNAFQAFFYYNQDLALLSERIYSLFAEFLLTLMDVPPIILNQFTLSCVIEEVHSTSDIEGVHSTRRELKDILEGATNNNHFSSIIKKYHLLTSGSFPNFITCEDIRNFYDEFVHVDVIADNPSHRLDGRLFRKEAADILSSSGKVIHRGLEPETLIIQTMSEALKFLNSEDFPALVRIAVFHYLFVYIHPFYDGNGRTARFISSCFVAKHLHYLIALRLSVTIKGRKNNYYAMLKEADSEINCGDLTPFIYGFLTFIADTISDINRKLKRKMVQYDKFKRVLAETMPDKLSFSIADMLLQASLFYGRGLAMEEIMSLTGKSRNTLKKRLAAMPVRVITIPRIKKRFHKIDIGFFLSRS